MPSPLPRLSLAVLLIFSIGACGKGDRAKPTKRDADSLPPVAAPISLPQLGVDKITRFNFGVDQKVLVALKNKSWAELRKYCESALARDPHHLEAHRLLAIALAQTGEHAAAVDHLVTALAADYLNYGASLPTEPALADFFATQHGLAVTQLASQIRDEYTRLLPNALVVVGRRSAFRWPNKAGDVAASRGELYAYDRDSKRFFRLTHTGHQVAGFVRAKSTSEIAAVGFDKVDRGDDGSAPVMARAWLQAFDPASWKPTTPKITLGGARAVAIYYNAGDQLLVASSPATGRWTLGEWTASSVDRTTGKLTKVISAMAAPRIELTLDEGRVVLPPAIEGVAAAWTGEPPRAPELAVGTTKIAVPESGQAAHETVALAPGGGLLAFATAVDPCAQDSAPSLYVANARTGALKHVLTARSRFATRWLDATSLAYEDGDGAIRIWDAATGREAIRLENKAGIALDALSLASAPLCKQAPPVAEPAGSADEMPPEETAPGGPAPAP